MADSNNRLICEILDLKFKIPSYQRGYKWTEKQVKDILNDINNNVEKFNEKMYSLQPLVVIKDDNDKDWYRVIDGQQRLTTIFLICSALGIEIIYNLKYESRDKSENFLSNISETLKPCYDNSDYYYISNAFLYVKKWMCDKEEQTIENYKAYLIEKCFFLWYEPKIEPNLESEIKVFNSLNSGKISLNDSELIKAELIGDNDINNVARKWDDIEFKLQNNELFYFAYGDNKLKPKAIIDSRIQILFQIILNVYEIDENRQLYDAFVNTKDKIDGYKNYFENENEKNILFLMSYICDWYDDKILYHLIGYLIWCNDREIFGDTFLNNNEKIKKVIEDNKEFKTKIKNSKSIIGKIYELYKYKSDKNQFKEIIKEVASKTLYLLNSDNRFELTVDNCEKLGNIMFYDNRNKDVINPNISYEMGQLRKFLLMHNILFYINRNKAYKTDLNYDTYRCIKFPFHLFKSEKWDVEHIASYINNDFSRTSDKKEFLIYAYKLLEEQLDAEKNITGGSNIESVKSLINEIKEYYEKDNNKIEVGQQDFKFESLLEKIMEVSHENEKNLNDDDKCKFGNFVLLNSSINRGYRNALYYTKRQWIIDEEQSIIRESNDEKDIMDSLDTSVCKNSFVPDITRNVFLKYFTPYSNQNLYWTKNDIDNYFKSFIKAYKEFFGGINNEEI